MLAEYDAMVADALRPVPELMKTTWPPARRSAGISASVTATAPTTFTSNVARQSSTVESATGPGKKMPALWTSTSSSPIAAVAAAIASVSVTSSGSVVAPSRSAVACNAGEGRPANSKVCVGARAVAMAAPIPRLAPVMSAVRMPAAYGRSQARWSRAPRVAPIKLRRSQARWSRAPRVAPIKLRRSQARWSRAPRVAPAARGSKELRVASPLAAAAGLATDSLAAKCSSGANALVSDSTSAG